MGSAAHTALAVATALSWLGAGTLVLRRLRDPTNRLLDLLNRVAAGVIVWSLGTAALGWLGILYAWLVVSAFVPASVGGLVAALHAVRAAPCPRPRAWRQWERMLALLLVVYVLLGLVSTLAPVSSEDALFYHAAGPVLFAHMHSLVTLPWAVQAYQPFSVEMLVVDGVLLWDPIQGALAPLLLAFAATVTVGGIGYRLGGRGTALLAAAIFGAQPFMLWLSSSTFVEPGLALMTALVTWNLWRLAETRRPQFAVLAGLAGGAAAGMKYDGLAAIVVLVVAAAALLKRRLDTAAVAGFGVAAVTVALPWYVKNAIATGNPVYPLFFGGQNREAAAALRAGLRGYGRGHSLVDALLVPFRFLTSGRSFDRGDFVSPLFLAFAPVSLLVRRLRIVVLAGVFASVVYLAVWFVNSQQARFLVPLMPAFAIAGAVGAVALAARGEVGRLAVAVVTSGAFLAGLAISVVYTSQFARYVVGGESAAAFLSAKSQYYDGMAWLNRHAPHGVVLTRVPSVLYLRQPYVVATADNLPSTVRGRQLEQFFHCHRVRYVAVLADDTLHIDQFRPLLGRLLARVTVHSILSRTREQRGPAVDFLVYRARHVTLPCATAG